MCWRGFHSSYSRWFMTHSQRKLREMPAAAAAARAAALHFYAVRQQRRCLRDVNHQVSVKDGSPSAGDRVRPRRSRLGRLRDRLRAVSHRIRIRTAIEGRKASSITNIDRREGEIAEAGGRGKAGISSKQQLLKPTRWVKNEVRVTDKLKRSLEALIFEFKCSCGADWMGPGAPSCRCYPMPIG